MRIKDGLFVLDCKAAQLGDGADPTVPFRLPPHRSKTALIDTIKNIALAISTIAGSFSMPDMVLAPAAP